MYYLITIYYSTETISTIVSKEFLKNATDDPVTSPFCLSLPNGADK